MKLQQWLSQNDMRIYALALAIGTSPSHLYNVLRYKKCMSASLAQRIEEVTGGEVKANELMLPSERGDIDMHDHRKDKKTK